MTRSKVVLLLFFVCVTVSGQTQRCFYQRCLSCHDEQVYDVGASVDCDVENWVSAQWLHNLGHPPPSTDTQYNIHYTCLKMVASPDDTTWENTVDIIRGCVPTVQVDSVCAGLVAVERARAHTNARCFLCRGNNCNISGRTNASYLILTIAISIFAII